VASSRSRSGATCAVAVAVIALAGCDTDRSRGGTSHKDEATQQITTPSGQHVTVTAEATKARSTGSTRPAACGRQRGVGPARDEINDEFCVYPEADGRTQGAIIYSGSNEPDLRIVASAPAGATAIRLRSTSGTSLSGQILTLPGSRAIRLALLNVRVTALPGTIEMMQGSRVIASYRLRRNPCKRLGQAEFTCQTPIRLTAP
jgi:hypothetical protein